MNYPAVCRFHTSGAYDIKIQSAESVLFLGNLGIIISVASEISRKLIKIQSSLINFKEHFH